jgi:biopolymer transport protein ExbD
VRIREQSYEEESGVNLTPLIDMVFLLLIFFLVATKFAQEERDAKVNLPKAGPERPMSEAPSQLIINILRDGSLTVGGGPVSWQQLGDVLAETARNAPHRTVLIRADEKSYHMYYAEVVRLCHYVGIAEAKIGYLIDEKKAGVGGS